MDDIETLKTPIKPHWTIRWFVNSDGKVTDLGTHVLGAMLFFVLFVGVQGLLFGWILGNITYDEDLRVNGEKEENNGNV